MKANEIIQQHPEWVKNPRATQKAIQATATRYVQELEGSRNFAALIADDIETLLSYRHAIINPVGETKDFADIAIIGNETVEDGARRQAKVYAAFIKAIISELSGKAICTAAQVDQWRERYGVKLEGLKGKPAKVSAKPTNVRLSPIDEDTLKTVYNGLKDTHLDCSEETFVSYFSKQGIEDREPLTWKGAKYQFAILWKGMCKLAGKKGNTPWELSKVYFRHDYEDLAGAYKSAKEKLPKGFNRMESIFERIEESEKTEEISRLKKEGISEYLNNLLS